LPLVKLKHHIIASISSCGIVNVLAIAVHTAVVRIPVVAFFSENYFLENFLKNKVKVRVISGKEREEERERPNILNIVAWVDYLAT